MCFLVDGFDLYHFILEALRLNPAASMKWLDLSGFRRSLLPCLSKDARLERVFYFSATADFRPDKAARHGVYVSALRATGVEVQMTRFKEKEVTCPACRVEFKRHEEKQTDVAVAVKLLEVPDDQLIWKPAGW